MIALHRASLYALAVILGFRVVGAKGTPPANGGDNGKVDEAVRCISLPGTKVEGPLDLYLARTKAKPPSAVLVLFPDQGQDVKTLLNSPAWRDFAETHSLALAAMVPTAGPAPAAKNTPSSIQSQAEPILQALGNEFGGSPLLLYGEPWQAALVQSLLKANPKRVMAWCLRAPSHLTAVDGPATPPGLVVCYKENKELYDTLTDDFTRARKKGARLGWLSLPGDRSTMDNKLSLDSFVRRYLAAALMAKPGMDGWANLDTKLAVSSMDANTAPEHSSYFPDASLISAWANLHESGKPTLTQLLIQERVEDTFNPAQPKLHLYLRKPLTAGQSGKVEGVLAYCTWQKEKESLVGRLQNKDDFLVRYAEQHRLALLTWDTAQAWSTKENADQRSQQENFQDNLDFEKLAQAWERGMHVLCHQAGLPENDFLLYGISRGAQWAHRLALRKPGHFLAVHIHVNSTYDWPTPAAKNILWLQTTGEREVGYEAAVRFYGRARDMGYPIIFKAGEGLGHDSSPQIEELGRRFFDYALGVKVKRDELTARAGQTPSGRSAQPDLYVLSGLGSAPYFADLINQEVYAADQETMIPANQLVPLPTKALAQAWGKVVDLHDLVAVSNSPPANPFPSLGSSAGMPMAPGAVVEDDADRDAYQGGWGEAGGGTGFGKWKFQDNHGATNSFAGHFLAKDNENLEKAAIASNGKAFGLYANGSAFESSVAFRALPTPLKAGDSFSFQMTSLVIEQKGATDSPGTSAVGLTLRHGCASQSVDDYDREARFEIVNLKGQRNYQVYDGEDTHDTGVAHADQGITVTVALTSANTYDLKITRLADQVTTVLKGRRLSPGGAVESLCLFNRNGEKADGLFNNLRIVIGPK